MNILQAKSATQKADQAAGWSVYTSSRRALALVWTCVMLLPEICHADAQDYSLDWWDANAGGISAGDNYTVRGTIGQPEAGTLSGGSFTLTGGFWGTVTQAWMPSMPPAITITLTRTNTVVLTWPSPSVGFLLQQTEDLKASSWTGTALNPTDDGIALSVVLPPDPGVRFYRLKK